MVADADPVVMAYDVLLLCEMDLADEECWGKTVVVHHILNRLHELDSWLQSQLLSKLQCYNPADEQEALDIMVCQHESNV
jgi:hypothetical protein